MVEVDPLLIARLLLLGESLAAGTWPSRREIERAGLHEQADDLTGDKRQKIDKLYQIVVRQLGELGVGIPPSIELRFAANRPNKDGERRMSTRDGEWCKPARQTRARG